MRRGAVAGPALVLLLSAAGRAAPCVAQESPLREVELSSVVTLPIAIPASVVRWALEGDSITFRSIPATGFRSAGVAEGQLDLREGDLPYLPVTLSVGPDLSAGLRHAADVEFRGPAGVDTVRADVVVLPSTGFRLSLASTGSASPGGRIEIAWEVTNQGNVADTVSLKFDSRLGAARRLPVAVPLPPFSTASGEIVVDILATAPPMPTLVVVKAHGVHDTTFATLEVPVRDRDGLFASFVRVPTRVFLGSSVESGGPLSPAFGIEAEGLLRPGVRLRVEAHERGEDVSSFAFRGMNIGPRFRAQLDSRAVSAAAGDVTSRAAVFAGYNLQGRGGRVDAGSETLRFHAHAARPLGAGGRALEGHQFAGGLDVATAPVLVGGRVVSEVRRDDPGATDQALRTAYVRFESSLPGRHGFDVEAGWVRLEDLEAGRIADGPAFAGRYGYRDALTVVDVSLVRQPLLEGLRAAGQDELRLTAVTEAPGDFGLAGQLYRLDGLRTSRAGVARIDGGEAGVFLPRGNGRYELRARVRRLYREDRLEEHSVEAKVDAPFGPGAVDGRLEVGRSYGRGLDRNGILRTDAGYNLRGRRGWARIGASFYRDAFSPGAVSLDVSGAYRVAKRLEIYGSYGGSADRFAPDDVALAQAGIQFDAQPDLSLLAGIEKSRGGADGLRFSLGVRKGLPLPVPFPQQRSVQGTVFEDLDGDGKRAPEEPYLDGVRLTMGAYAVTTRRGYFVFPSGAPKQVIQVDLASLGAGFLPPQPIPSPDGDQIDIPVHRAASLRVGAYFDRDRDGVRDPTEMPMANVELEIGRPDEPGVNVRTGPDGEIELAAVRPGGYIVRVAPASLPRRASVPALASITVRAGEAAVVELAIPARPVVLLEATEDPGAAGGSGQEEAEGGRK